MKGFITYSNYVVEDKKTIITIYGRLENGESFLARVPEKQYFYIKNEDFADAEKLADFETEKTEKTTVQKEEVTKIILDTPKEIKELKKLFEESGIICYEADIRPSYRYLMDKRIKGSLEIEGEFEKGLRIDRVYENPKIKAIEYLPKNLRILSFDIEAHHQNSKLYAISLYSNDYKEKVSEVYLIGKSKKAICFDEEKELLQKFKERIIELDPDVIIGWNVIDFDLDYLRKKYEEHNLSFDWGRDNTINKLNIQSQFFRDSSAVITGRVVLDGIHVLKGSFVKLPDYRLDTAAEHFLGERKIITTTKKAKYDEINDLFKNNPDKLVEYNLKDSILAYDILRKSGTFDLTTQRSIISGMPMDRVNASIASLDQVYIPEMNKRGLVAQTKAFMRKDSGLAGGFVMNSKPGIYNYVLVLDFKSLYPSIIRTFNIDPISYLGMNIKKRDVIMAPNGATFDSTVEGILPELLSNLLNERMKAKKRNDIPASNAIKLLMNSFWGVLASPMCRFFNFDMASGITSFARFLTKKTAEVFRKEGYEVIYGDTDSVFVNVKADSVEEAEKIGMKLEKFANSFYEDFVKNEFKRNSALELEFEKTYKKFWMPRVRGSEEGSKKRYAGLLVKEGKEKMDFTGLEFVRRDWTALAKEFQLGLLDKVFHDQPVEKFVSDFVNDIKNGKKDELMLYRKALRKELESYTKTTPPHVKAARKLVNGIKDLDDNIVEYYLTTDGPEPVQNLKHSIDYDHYIDKQIKPLADSILEEFDTSFGEVIGGAKQTTLGNF